MIGVFLGFLNMIGTALVKLPAWLALQAHFLEIKSQRMRDWFEKDSQRFEQFSLSSGGLLFDYSKNHLTAETIHLFMELARSCALPEKIEALFSGKHLNVTEARPALHTALRDSSETPLFVNQENVHLLVKKALAQMSSFVDAVRLGQWRGSTGKPLRDIVNIGIGGSHLGPRMTTQAFANQADGRLRFYFISDVDDEALLDVWQELDPERTLFIVSSKSFKTAETISNAKRCRSWLQDKLGHNEWRPHFVAVTAHEEEALDFGVPEKQIFPIWDWVGGRYSIWSAMGLPLALQLGMPQFQEFLAGANDADQHFRSQELQKNIPVLLALLSVWYINFFGASTQAIIPYSSRLKYLPVYLQQLDMESNGKGTNLNGEETDYLTGPILWGELGIHGQHAFHQLLHQGRHLVPVDFILVGNRLGCDVDPSQDFLIANALAQAQALMQGKSAESFVEELLTQGQSPESAKILAKHKEIPGNRPSSILFLDALTARNLGLLLAFYEHKIFVQSVIWNINPFDQWGVELGKSLLADVLQGLQESNAPKTQDASTRNLILHYKKLKKRDRSQTKEDRAQ